MNSLGSEITKESVQKLMVNDCEIVHKSDMAENVILHVKYYIRYGRKCNIFVAQLRQPSNLNFPGCFPTKDMQTLPHPPSEVTPHTQNGHPLRSGHLDIKDAQCAETKDVLKKSHHIAIF